MFDMSFSWFLLGAGILSSIMSKKSMHECKLKNMPKWWGILGNVQTLHLLKPWWRRFFHTHDLDFGLLKHLFVDFQCGLFLSSFLFLFFAHEFWNIFLKIFISKLLVFYWFMVSSLFLPAESCHVICYYHVFITHRLYRWMKMGKLGWWGTNFMLWSIDQILHFNSICIRV